MIKILRRYLLITSIGIVVSMIPLSLNSASESKTSIVPNWTLRDAQDQEISLSDYQGKPFILHFWATWCPYCKKVQPGLERLYSKYKSDGLEVIGISWWEDEGAEPQKVLEDRGLTFKTLVNGDAVAKQYGVKGTPATFFINKDSQVVWMTTDSDPNDPEMEEVVKRMLGE